MENRTVMIVVLGLAVVGLVAIVYQLIKQQGRILLRLDELERLAGEAGHVGRGAALESMQSESEGLAPGTPVAPFSLPDLSGRMVSLEEFRGRQVLLVHWNPECGFCDLIAPDLAGLESDLQKRNIQPVLVSSGGIESNLKLAE